MKELEVTRNRKYEITYEEFKKRFPEIKGEIKFIMSTVTDTLKIETTEVDKDE